MKTISKIAGTTWTEFSSADSFGIQNTSAVSVALYIGPTSPDEGTRDFILLSGRSDRSFSAELGGSTAYIRSLDPVSALLRGWET